MSLDEFISVFKQIINEFRILNEHFDAKTKSMTSDYDVVFSNWIRDMNKRYHGLPLNMHWGTSSPHITKNQILFDVRYRDEYFCEVKYLFDTMFVDKFRDSVMNTLEVFKKILVKFQSFNTDFDFKPDSKQQAYEKAFSEWKKTIFDSFPDVTIDIHWTNKLELLTLNPVFINVMFKDVFLFEIKHWFISESAAKKNALEDNIDDL